MSLTSWAKRSQSSNGGGLLFILLVVLCLNAYYRNVPDQVQKQSSGQTDSAIAANASKEMKAFLMTIRWAEGTASQDGYQIMYGGGKFKSFAKHPRQVQTTYYKDKNGVERVFNASSCAGAYQICEGTYDEYAPILGIKDFSPASQDAIAIALIQKFGADKKAEEGNIKQAIFSLCSTWASLPCSDNNLGYYPKGQTVKPIDSLMKRYEEYLK